MNLGGTLILHVFALQLDVQEAKEIEEHPQWDISEGEEEEKEESQESEFASDEDIEEDYAEEDDDD